MAWNNNHGLDSCLSGNYIWAFGLPEQVWDWELAIIMMIIIISWTGSESLLEWDHKLTLTHGWSYIDIILNRSKW